MCVCVCVHARGGEEVRRVRVAEKRVGNGNKDNKTSRLI